MNVVLQKLMEHAERCDQCWIAIKYQTGGHCDAGKFLRIRWIQTEIRVVMETKRGVL